MLIMQQLLILDLIPIQASQQYIIEEHSCERSFSHHEHLPHYYIIVALYSRRALLNSNRPYIYREEVTPRQPHSERDTE